MAEANIHQKDKTPAGAERRSFYRYTLDLYATVKKKDAGTMPVTVRSFCVGGMHLAYDRKFENEKDRSQCTPAMGDKVEITCQLPTELNRKPIIFSGKIVRAGAQGAGLCFINPDVNDLLFLQKLAMDNQKINRQRDSYGSTVDVPAVLASATKRLADSVAQSKQQAIKQAEKKSSPPSSPANDPLPASINQPAQKVLAAGDKKKYTDLVQRCNVIFERHVLQFINTFFKVVDHHLFSVARDEMDAFRQKVFFDAKEEIEATRDSIRKTFILGVADAITCYSPEKFLHLAENYAEVETKSLTLSIMGEEDFDEWLADTVAIDNIETNYRNVLVDLDKRLSVIWDAEIHKENNLYGPYLLSHTFQKTIKQTRLIHQMKVVCYKQFENVLLNNLGALFDELNELLIKNNVLPVIQYKIRVDNTARPKPKVDSDADGTITQEIIQPSVKAVAEDLASTISHIATKPEERVKKHVAPQEPVKDLYQLVSDLKTLQHELLQRRVSGVQDNANVHPLDAVAINQAPNENVCSAEDLLDAMSRIQPAMDQPIAIDEHPEVFKSRLKSALQSVPKNSQAGIGRREEQIIDVASSLFHSVLTDKQVAESVRAWIKRLEIPVLKIAIVDDALFINRKHFVRQVINKIAELEILTNEGDESQRAIVKRAIDWLVNLINTEFDHSADVFHRASHQLDLLIDIQNQTFASNLKHVVNVSKLEENKLALTYQPEPDAAEAIDEHWVQWRKKLERITEGAWLVFGVKHDSPVRLRLAWFATHTKRYVFVNVLGKKDRIVPSQELIGMLANGEVIVLDNADEPALDRAQYAMLQDLHERLLQQSTHDQLTGLINRREFDRRLEKVLTKTRCVDSKHALLFIDVDRFNVFNNTCGYQGADQLLIEITKLIKHTLEHEYEFSRLGSDEFGVLLLDCALEDALDISEQIVQTIGAYKFISNEQSYAVSASLGLVPVTRAWDTTSSLLQAAESSCGVAKEIGGNRMQLYHAGHTKLRQRNKMMNWVSEIETALERNSFQLKGQKIAPIQDGVFSKGHYEILLTVQDKEGNELSIGEFIEAAEWYNRIIEIDRWVVKHALAWMANNPSLLDSIDTFSINLSGRSMNDAGLIDYVEKQLKESGVAAEKICFEITETAGISNLSDAAEFIARIKEFGCRFSLDDFGSGMSSYAYLKNLAIDYIKIDGTFIRDLENSPSDYAVVKSICEIGHFLGKKIIAECVEQEATLQILKDLGIDYAQGFYIERPKPLSEIQSPRSDVSDVMPA